MLEAAKYFEDREDTVDKAVLLYHRAGNLPKAIELVFKVGSQLFKTYRNFLKSNKNRINFFFKETQAIFFKK
jgi:hypothetical protein